MKILYLITKSETGGAQTHVYQMSKFLKEKGEQVAIMSYPGGWLEKVAEKLEIPFYPNLYFKNTYNPFTLIKAIKRVREIIKEFDPDLVSCHSTIAGIAGRLATKNKVPTIFTAHGWAFTEGVPVLRRKLAILVERFVVRYCSKIICVSEFDRQLALKYYVAPKKKLITIHNGAEITEDYHQRGQGQEIKVVFVGRLSSPKDPLLLLQAFCDLPAELQNKTSLTFVGGGDKMNKMKNFIRDNDLKRVRLLGQVPRKRVFKILQQSDIFVLSTHWEGFPRSILEAMSVGLPVIASDVGGVSEQVEDGVNGFVIPPGDKESLRKSLVKLIKNASLRAEMGKASRKRAIEEFSLEKLYQDTYRIYQQVLNSS